MPLPYFYFVHDLYTIFLKTTKININLNIIKWCTNNVKTPFVEM